jgi:hypothetical protein
MANRHLRLGRVRDLRLLGVVALVAVIAAALVVTAWARHDLPPLQSAHPSTTSTADAPYQIGARSICPLGRPVLASSNQASYPPGHPGHPPPDARPVACYPNLAQATAAGYPPAPLPTGAVQLGGVYLTPTSQAFRTRCQHAADQLGFVVPCPALLPTTAPGTAPPDLCEGGPVACSGGQVVFVLNDGGFLVPPGYLGVEQQPQGHLVIMATPRRPNDPRPPNEVLGCYAEHPVATATVHGTRAALLRCPTGSALNSGHTLVRWSQRGVDMAVSLHGWSELNQRLVLLLAAHAHLLSPRS